MATDVLGGSHALQGTRAANPSLSVVLPPTTGGSVRRDDLFNTTMGGGVPYHPRGHQSRSMLHICASMSCISRVLLLHRVGYGGPHVKTPLGLVPML